MAGVKLKTKQKKETEKKLNRSSISIVTVYETGSAQLPQTYTVLLCVIINHYDTL